MEVSPTMQLLNIINNERPKNERACFWALYAQAYDKHVQGTDRVACDLYVLTGIPARWAAWLGLEFECDWIVDVAPNVLSDMGRTPEVWGVYTDAEWQSFLNNHEMTESEFSEDYGYVVRHEMFPGEVFAYAEVL